MPDLKLFVAPNTCARVATIVLEEIGVAFETELIRTGAGQQNTPEYLKINPKGKVPALLIDGVPLTENVAILSWLNAEFPDTHVLPPTSDSFEALKQTADLAFFAGTVHPTTTRISMPVKFIEDKAASFQLVRPVGIQDMKKIMGMNVFQTSVILFYVSMGNVEGGTAPILIEGAKDVVYSNPLPHVLMLTAIVVGVASAAVGLALIVRIDESYGTIDEDEILALDREEDVKRVISEGGE